MDYSYCGPVNIFTAASAERIKNKVKESHKAHGLQREGVAALLGVSRQTANAVESDKYGPTLVSGMKLIRLLETLVEELLTLEGREHPPNRIGSGGAPAP